MLVKSGRLSNSWLTDTMMKLVKNLTPPIHSNGYTGCQARQEIDDIYLDIY